MLSALTKADCDAQSGVPWSLAVLVVNGPAISESVFHGTHVTVSIYSIDEDKTAVLNC